MALDTKSLGYLIDPAFQIEGISGKPAIGGWIEVYLAGTDTKVITFSNFDGTKNPFKIPLNNDGRAVVLAPITDSYDFYVKDSFGNLMFSRLNVVPSIGGGSVTVNGFTRITNTDDTLDIQVTGSLTGKNTYDINTNHIPLGLEEPLYWKEDEPDGAIIAVDLTDVTEKVKDAVIEEIGDLGDRMDAAEANIENLEINKQDRLTEYQLSKIENAVDAEYVISQDAATKADIMSNVYTKEETRTKINEGVNTGKADILTKVYTKQQVDTELAKKQDKLTSTQMYNVNNAVTDVSNLATKSELASYAKKSEIPNSYTKTESDAKYQSKGNYALVGDSYTKSESDNKYALKGDVPTDVYTKTEADNKFATKEEIPEPYELPKASDTVLGGIKVGNNLSITEDGTLNANGGISEISWGSITGSLDSQTDLKNALDGKQPTGDYALKSEIIDSYSKTESDAKYQDKSEYIYETNGTVYAGATPEWVAGGAPHTETSTNGFKIVMGTLTPVTMDPRGTIAFTGDLIKKNADGSYINVLDELSDVKDELSDVKDDLDDVIEVSSTHVPKYTYDSDTYNGIEIQDNHIHIWAGNAEWTNGTGVKIDKESIKYFASIGSGNAAPISTLNYSGLTSKLDIGRLIYGADVGYSGIKYTQYNGVVHDLTLKANLEDIPTKTSELENDSGFLTEHQDISNLATKTELSNGLATKQNTLTAGANIDITGNTISVTGELGKTYTGQNGVSVDNTNNKVGLDSTTYANVNKINSAKELVAGDNITISEVGNDIVISSTGGSSIPIGTIEV